MFKHILSPIDGSELSIRAGRHAIALAKGFNARLSAVMVCASFQQFTDKGYLAPVLDMDRRGWEQGVAARAGDTGALRSRSGERRRAVRDGGRR